MTATERAGTAVTPPATAAAAKPREAGRLAGLDGVRGLAALFVVLNHISPARVSRLSRGSRLLWAADGSSTAASPLSCSSSCRGSPSSVSPVRSRLAARLQSRVVRVPAGVAHSSAVLVGARFQPVDDVVRRGSTGLGFLAERLSRSLVYGLLIQDAGRCTDPQPCVLVDRHRGPALHRASLCCCFIVRRFSVHGRWSPPTVAWGSW